MFGRDSKDKKKRKVAQFPILLNLISELEVAEHILEKIIEDDEKAHKVERARLQLVVKKINEKFTEFADLILAQREVLGLYISTSVPKIKYLKKLNKLIPKIREDIDKLIASFDIPDSLAMLDNMENAKISLVEHTAELEVIMTNFRSQAKSSLQWNYAAGNNNIAIPIFRKYSRNVGGKFDSTIGRGDHFGVRFNGFILVASPSQHNHNAVAGGTLAGSIDRDAATHLEAFGINPNYFKCYYMKSNGIFRDVFVKLYKDDLTYTGPNKE